MKKIWILILLLFPLNVFAYSNKIAIGGEPIGIEIHSKGVYITDFYKVNKKYIAKESGLKKGDLIKEINHIEINNIKDMNDTIKNPGTYTIKIERDSKEKEFELEVQEENGEIKTGIYGKDEINGIGTLSYIDPETQIYASLGHEILESSSMTKFKTNTGYIYDVEVNYINKSEKGKIGDIHASFNNTILGTIQKNEINGIYGKYTEDINEGNLLEVGTKTNIKKGEAFIRSELEEETKNYSINIISIDEKDPVKNIYFEITDKDLLEKTGGVIQGMSGSPIIQDNKIIGVVNYVIVTNSKKGYGIFIEKMLEEGDKLLQP